MDGDGVMGHLGERTEQYWIIEDYEMSNLRMEIIATVRDAIRAYAGRNEALVEDLSRAILAELPRLLEKIGVEENTA